jgi:acetyl esterase/lipase
MRPAYSAHDPDRDYANGDFIPGAAEFPPRWEAEAARFRAALGARAGIGLPYGPEERQVLDLFHPEGEAKGSVVFVHGGYWKAFDRSLWSHLAAGPLARGLAVAMPSYTLAPQARLGAMTAEIARACRMVAERVAGPMVATGHSAGGHLAARMGCADLDVPVSRVVPISPLAELEPLRKTSMNAELRIDEDEAATESPARLGLRAGVAAHVWVGGAERPAFLWQARVLAEEWGCPWTVAPSRHHFDVIDDLADPSSALCEALASAI